jgi:hypothetical protein
MAPTWLSRFTAGAVTAGFGLTLESPARFAGHDDFPAVRAAVSESGCGERRQSRHSRRLLTLEGPARSAGHDFPVVGAAVSESRWGERRLSRHSRRLPLA